MVLKQCFIPNCKNTNVDSEKIFFLVPSKPLSRRKAWFDSFSNGSCKIRTTILYCCEDHFDLEQDSANWMYFKSMSGTRLRLRTDALPHKYLILPDKNQPVGSQITDSVKKSRLEFEEYRKNLSNLFPLMNESQDARPLSCPILYSILKTDTINQHHISEAEEIIVKDPHAEMRKYYSALIMRTNKPEECEQIVESDSHTEINKEIETNNHDQLIMQKEVKEEITIEDTMNYKCSKCDFTTTLYSSFLVHDHKCNGTDNSQKQRFKRHTISHINKRPYKYPCKFCKKSFKSMHSRQKHQTRHMKPQFKCDSCEQMFIHREQLKIHSQVHFGQTYPCTICDKVFSKARALRTHMVVHTEQLKYKCEICDKGFRYRKFLVVHMRTHEEVKTYKCSDCDKTFCPVVDLKKQLIVHRPAAYECKFCNATFIRYQNLQLHMKKHMGRSYKCDLCDKSFIGRANLGLHKKSHEGEKPFECNICCNRFEKLTHFKFHMKTHSEITPFTCKACVKTFADKQSLEEHMRTHIVGAIDKCEVCNNTFRFEVSLRKYIRVKEMP